MGLPNNHNNVEWVIRMPFVKYKDQLAGMFRKDWSRDGMKTIIRKLDIYAPARV